MERIFTKRQRTKKNIQRERKEGIGNQQTQVIRKNTQR